MKKENFENVVLVYLELPAANVEEDMYELNELIKTAGGNVVLSCSQKRNSIDANTVVGSGKLDEIKASLANVEDNVDVVIFSCPLNSTQRATLNKTLKTDVIDKIDLILDIFALRATSAEGKKQVELAQLSYNLATKPQGDFSRQGAGIGTRGPGETKLETNKRAIRERMFRLRQELKEIERRRAVTRKRREDNKVFTIALVGYTNAGKSTLFNRLTESNIYADDKLFATLDTTVRRLKFDNGAEALLCDTVGFIKELPHMLLNAFKSTLEEAVRADLLLNVCDISDPNVANHIEVTEKILAELGATAPVIRVYNKTDKLASGNSFSDKVFSENVSSVYVSAESGKNVDVLIELIKHKIMSEYATVKLRTDYGGASALLSKLNIYGNDIKVEYYDTCVEIVATLPRKFVDLFSDNLCF